MTPVIVSEEKPDVDSFFTSELAVFPETSDDVEMRATTTEQGDDRETGDDEGVAPGYDLEQLVEKMSSCGDTGRTPVGQKTVEVFRDVFSKNGDDLGVTHLGVHNIDTGDARQIRQALRRHPHQLMQEIDRQVGKMVTSGVFEASNSPWAFNLVIVKI